MPMLLRPHHALCIQKFTGQGYSDRFTAHMAAVVADLTARRGAPVTLVPGCDGLCGPCPHQQDGVCASSRKVAAIDRAVLAACGLAFGETIGWGELARRARERVLETDAFYTICARCQWFGLCGGEGGLL